MHKKHSSCSGLEWHASKNNKKRHLFFLHLCEICTSMPYGAGPAMYVWMCLQSAALLQSWILLPQRHTKAGQSFPSEEDDVDSPIEPDWVLQGGRNVGDVGSNRIPAVVSAAQMTGLYGNTSWHGSAEPRNREHSWQSERSWLPTSSLPSLPAAYRILHTEWLLSIYVIV